MRVAIHPLLRGPYSPVVAESMKAMRTMKVMKATKLEKRFTVSASPVGITEYVVGHPGDMIYPVPP